MLMVIMVMVMSNDRHCDNFHIADLVLSKFSSSTIDALCINT